ncbi:hypothetical protein, partial [Glaesserella parasuis]
MNKHCSEYSNTEIANYLIQAVDSTVKSAKSVGSSKNDRVNAMAAANVGFEALRAAEQLQGVAD